MAAFARRFGKIAPQGRFSAVPRIVVVMLILRDAAAGQINSEGNSMCRAAPTFRVYVMSCLLKTRNPQFEQI